VLKKKFVELTPHDPREIEEADRHYLDVHFRFAATTFRDIDAVRAYHSNRAVAQLDLTGGFRQRPDLWRLVVTQWDAANDGGHSVGWLDERIRNLFFLDRKGVIAGVHSWELEEELVVDRRSGQLTSVKYVARYPAAQFGPARAFEEHYTTEHLPALRSLAEAADGLRLVLTNQVAREAETRTRPDGHTEYSGAYLPDSNVLRFEELWFDSSVAAELFFADPAVLALFRDGPCGKVPIYQMDEHCGIDRR
jgi:hypothetical protein